MILGQEESGCLAWIGRITRRSYVIWLRLLLRLRKEI